MQGLNTQKAPSVSVVLPHYAYAAVSFFVLSLLIALSASSFIGHYFQPRLLAITHIAALGWGTMIIFGALYQLLPVILEAPLYSETLAKITFFLFGSGIPLLAYCFWIFSVGILLQIAASIMLVSFFLFFFNVVQTARKTENRKTEADFIVTSAIWLVLTGVVGVLMSFNFQYVFLDQSHLEYLKLHAHLGIIGWFLMLIMGVSSKLLPMFLISHQLNEKKLNYAYYLVNGGLIAFTIDMYFFRGTVFLPVYGLIIISGIIFWISYIYESYKKRVRKDLDIGMKHSFLALSIMFLPAVLGLVISADPFFKDVINPQIFLVYGISVFLGFITSLILGQTYKTLPFIVWLHKYKKLIGKTKTPLPKELYSESIATWQFRFYGISMLSLVFGMFFSKASLIQAGGVLLLITAALYNINVFKMLFHTVRKDKITQ